mmetsp:Transcript_1456/g.2608  ORF Transcript_1456/g.2608 Transcript_1456/m.2608 type:complete len:145 (+) Transcript_1456:216-650(+)
MIQYKPTSTPTNPSAQFLPINPSKTILVHLITSIPPEITNIDTNTMILLGTGAGTKPKKSGTSRLFSGSVSQSKLIVAETKPVVNAETVTDNHGSTPTSSFEVEMAISWMMTPGIASANISKFFIIDISCIASSYISHRTPSLP